MLAALVQYLAAGARKSDGTANASGIAWFYAPGTNTPTVVYNDANAEVQASQPITLDAAGKAEVYVVGPCRLVVQQVVSTGVYSTVDDFDYVSASAPSVAVRNDGFTGVDPDTGGTVAGGDTTLHAVLTSLNTSTGGVDAKYQESTGAMARTIKAKFAEIWVSVKDFGAVGNGIADDTTAIQAAMNRVASLGGGVVYFPPGTYLISSALTLSSKNGVSLVGAGAIASVIKTNSTTQNIFTLSTCAGFFMRSIGLTASATNSGTAVALSACSSLVIDSVIVDTTGGGTFLVCASVSGASSKTQFINCAFTAKAADANARGIAYSATSSRHSVVSCVLDGQSGQPINYDSTISQVVLAGSNLSGSLTFAATLTGSIFNIIGNYFVSTPTVSATTDISVFQAGNRWPAQVITCATGTSQTPQILSGTCHISAQSGGAGTVTVNAPSPPVTNNRDPFYIIFTNQLGGGSAVTWSLNALYKTSAAIPTTDAHTITVGFKYDNEASVYREFSRADTLT